MSRRRSEAEDCTTLASIRKLQQLKAEQTLRAAQAEARRAAGAKDDQADRLSAAQAGWRSTLSGPNVTVTSTLAWARVVVDEAGVLASSERAALRAAETADAASTALGSAIARADLARTRAHAARRDLSRWREELALAEAADVAARRGGRW